MSKQNAFSFDIPTVSELTDKIKYVLESNFRDILVEGEISNLNQSRNGHYYFTVKDDGAQLPCVIWRSTAQRLDAELRDGQQVVLGGDIQVYAPHGRYQMIVSLVQQAGTGRLQQKFEELKRQLEEEGLFDSTRKKKLPPFPKRIGVITSATGAAFQDIRSAFEKRWPIATLYLHHASVQGLNAAAELANAIQYFDNSPNPVDLIIIGRGGGSIEDLWPFNEELVARTISKCSIPVVSAVGHEVDFSISDFVADVRAATPTHAVMISTPDIHDIRYMSDHLSNELVIKIQTKINELYEHVSKLSKSHSLLVVQEKLNVQSGKVDRLSQALRSRLEQLITEKKSGYWKRSALFLNNKPDHRIRMYQQQLLQLNERLISRYERHIEQKTARLRDLKYNIEKHNPKEVLSKGYTRIVQNGSWVRNQKDFKKGILTEIEWQDGTAKFKS